MREWVYWRSMLKFQHRRKVAPLRPPAWQALSRSTSRRPLHQISISWTALISSAKCTTNLRQEMWWRWFLSDTANQHGTKAPSSLAGSMFHSAKRGSKSVEMLGSSSSNSVTSLTQPIRHCCAEPPKHWISSLRRWDRKTMPKSSSIGKSTKGITELSKAGTKIKQPTNLAKNKFKNGDKATITHRQLWNSMTNCIQDLTICTKIWQQKNTKNSQREKASKWFVRELSLTGMKSFCPKLEVARKAIPWYLWLTNMSWEDWCSTSAEWTIMPFSNWDCQTLPPSFSNSTSTPISSPPRTTMPMTKITKYHFRRIQM